MQVPLIAKTTIDKYDQTQKLELWINGHVAYVDAPFKPYFYSEYPLKIAEVPEQVNKTIFSTMKESKLLKYSFKNTQELAQHKEDDSMEADLSLIDKIMIDDENFFTKYANDRPLKVLFFDIETDTTGMFPIPERNAIIAIGCKCGEKKAIFMAKTYNDDREILNKFFDFMDDVDPDIIVHYNGNNFDIPYCLARMKINNIPLNRWSRNKHDPHPYKDNISIGGRISYDLYHEAQKDQTLSGIKNLKMKTLAKWIDKDKALDVKEVPYSEMRNMINTSKLREYLISDVLITESLYSVYSKNKFMLAEMYNVPLNLMIDSSASFLPNIIHGREFRKLNIVSDGMNIDRHPIYMKKKRGAEVDTFAPGLYNHPIYKVDYTSQYPRAVENFNLSPETVKILRYDNFTGEFKFDTSNPKMLICSFPDSTANKNIIISIDMEKRGFLSKFMSDVLTERFSIKTKMKSLNKGSTEYEQLNVRQNALKIVANATTGYHGNDFARFGDLAVYCSITGFGRWYIKLAMNGIKQQNGQILSIDTDGVYVNGKVDIDKLNEYLDQKTKEIFNLENHLHMEIDEYDAAFFRVTKGKNYVLKDGNKITFHGASFKGQHQPPFFDSCLEEIARDMFDGKVGRAIDIKSFPIEALIQNIKVKDESSYKGDGSLSMQLIQAAKREMPEVKLKDNDQLAYIKTDKGYELIMPGKVYGNIDWTYYQTILNRIYERLQIPDKKQVTFG